MGRPAVVFLDLAQGSMLELIHRVTPRLRGAKRYGGYPTLRNTYRISMLRVSDDGTGTGTGTGPGTGPE